MKKTIFLLYGVICYLTFFLTFLYAIGFIGNFIVPVKIDGEPTTPFASALIINLLLLSLFAVQHSIMARPRFKKWWTGIIPEPVERSTYVLLSSVALIILFRYWQPLGGSVWNVSDPIGVYILYGLFAFGWALVLVATFFDQSFWFVWFAPNMALFSGPGILATWIWYTVAIQNCAPSIVRGLVFCILGDTKHDGNTSVICGCYDSLYYYRDAIRRARLTKRFARVLSLQRSGPNVYSAAFPQKISRANVRKVKNWRGLSRVLNSS